MEQFQNDKIEKSIQNLFECVTDIPFEYKWKQELKKVSKCPQRQDSTNDQLKDLIQIANKFGFYDAADFIKTVLEKQK